jgi:Zn ribbon nucleic-acid-binding protein
MNPLMWWIRPLGAVVFVAALFAQLPDARVKRDPPEQPVPFSHKQHVANGLKCADCHPVPDPGDFATIPKTTTCMGCHASIKTDSPHIQKLATLHKEGRRNPWAPVYRIPEWVSFSHRKHLGVAGVTCQDCHGPVEQRVALWREKDLSMNACMECHRMKKASNECLLCHDQR